MLPAHCFRYTLFENDGNVALYIIGLLCAVMGVLVMISGVVKSTKFDEVTRSTVGRDSRANTELVGTRTTLGGTQGDNYSLVED